MCVCVSSRAFYQKRVSGLSFSDRDPRVVWCWRGNPKIPLPQMRHDFAKTPHVGGAAQGILGLYMWVPLNPKQYQVKILLIEANFQIKHPDYTWEIQLVISGWLRITCDFYLFVFGLSGTDIQSDPSGPNSAFCISFWSFTSTGASCFIRKGKITKWKSLN